mgnify:CR=1 FL=1
MTNRHDQCAVCRQSPLFACVLSLLATAACATEYFVDWRRPDDSGSGTSEQTAFRTIQAAVATAKDSLSVCRTGTGRLSTQRALET